jgi:hypothetical protein
MSVFYTLVKRRRSKKMGKFSDYEYRNQPWFDMNTFEGANQAIPMKTLVIYCFDPRAVEIPQGATLRCAAAPVRSRPPLIIPGSGGRTLFEGVNGRPPLKRTLKDKEKCDHERLSQPQRYSRTSRLTDS